MKTLIKRSLLTSLFLLSFTIVGFTQQPTLYSGNLAFLKGQTKINVKYDYENMKVLVHGLIKNEVDYINETKAEKNMKKRKPYLGDKWAEQWVNNRERDYQPRFESLFNNTKTKKGVVVGNYPDAPYTLILKTVSTIPKETRSIVELLIFIPIVYVYKVSTIDIEIWIVETNDEENVKAKMKMKNISSGEGGGSEAIRLQRTYGFCGKKIAKYFYKNKVFKAKREKG